MVYSSLDEDLSINATLLTLNRHDLIIEYSMKLLDHLHYPVAFDVFLAWLDILTESVIQNNLEQDGSNIMRRQRNIIELWNHIIRLEYR